MYKSIAILLFGTLLFSCALTPAVYSSLLIIFPQFPWPFSRVYDRVAMVVALVILYLHRESFPLDKIKTYIQMEEIKSNYRIFLFGVILSIITALSILPLIVLQGNIVWKEEGTSYYLYKIIKVVPAAIIISLIEEGFFRVIIFDKLKENFAPIIAAMACSLLYASVHFISPDKSFVYSGLSLTIGFEYLGKVGSRLLLPGIVPAFIGLFLVGMVLCYTIHRTKYFFLCVGLHSGWVMALKFSKYATTGAEGFNFPAGIGSRYFLMADPFSWLSIILVWLLLFLSIKKLKWTEH